MKIYQILETGEPNPPAKASAELVSTDNVGIEIELEGVPRNLYNAGRFKHWQAVKDGSLRGDGVELIFAGPKGGEKITEALDEMVNIIKKFKNVEVNDRTGMHCHVDIRDLEPRQLKTFLLLAVMFEEVFIHKTGDRNNNIFCCKFATSDIQLKFVSRIGFLNRRNFNKTFANVEKYASVNCQAISQKGSVEFRYHRGTYDRAEILLWINTLLSLKVFARNNEIDPEELTRIFSAGGGTQLFERVLGAELAANYCDETTEELLVQGMRLAQDALLLGKLDREQDQLIYALQKPDYQNKLVENFNLKPVKKKGLKIRKHGDALFEPGDAPFMEEVALPRNPMPVEAPIFNERQIADRNEIIKRHRQNRQLQRDSINPDRGMIKAYDEEIQRIQRELDDNQFGL